MASIPASKPDGEEDGEARPSFQFCIVRRSLYLMGSWIEEIAQQGLRFARLRQIPHLDRLRGDREARDGYLHHITILHRTELNQMDQARAVALYALQQGEGQHPSATAVVVTEGEGGGASLSLLLPPNVSPQSSIESLDGGGDRNGTSVCCSTGGSVCCSAGGCGNSTASYSSSLSPLRPNRSDPTKSSSPLRPVSHPRLSVPPLSSPSRPTSNDDLVLPASLEACDCDSDGNNNSSHNNNKEENHHYQPSPSMSSILSPQTPGPHLHEWTKVVTCGGHTVSEDEEGDQLNALQACWQPLREGRWALPPLLLKPLPLYAYQTKGTNQSLAVSLLYLPADFIAYQKGQYYRHLHITIGFLGSDERNRDARKLENVDVLGIYPNLSVLLEAVEGLCQLAQHYYSSSSTTAEETPSSLPPLLLTVSKGMKGFVPRLLSLGKEFLQLIRLKQCLEEEDKEEEEEVSPADLRSRLEVCESTLSTLKSAMEKEKGVNPTLPSQQQKEKRNRRPSISIQEELDATFSRLASTSFSTPTSSTESS